MAREEKLKYINRKKVDIKICKRSSLHEQFTMCYLGAKVSSLRRCTRDI